MEGDATFDEDDSFDESFIDGRVTFEDFLPDSDKENDVYSASHLGRSEVVQERELADPIPSTSKVVSIEKESDFKIITQGTEKNETSLFLMLVTFSQNRSQQKLLRIGNALIDTARNVRDAALQ